MATKKRTEKVEDLERQHIQLFLDRANELKSLRLPKRGFDPKVHFKADSKTGFEISSENPDEEDFRSFLMAFRKFIMQGEAIFLNHIHNICFKNLPAGPMQNAFSESKERWKKGIRNFGILLSVNGKNLSPEHLADLWVNGHYFHDDPKKAEELQKIPSYSISFARFNLYAFVIATMDYIECMASTIESAMRGKMI